MVTARALDREAVLTNLGCVDPQLIFRVLGDAPIQTEDLCNCRPMLNERVTPVGRVAVVVEQVAAPAPAGDLQLNQRVHRVVQVSKLRQLLLKRRLAAR